MESRCANKHYTTELYVAKPYYFASDSIEKIRLVR